MIPGVGPQLQDNGIRGALAFEYLPADLQRLEDSRAVADYDHWQATSGYTGRTFDRPATATERALLGHLGYELPDELTMRVQWINGIVSRRTSSQLVSEAT